MKTFKGYGPGDIVTDTTGGFWRVDEIIHGELARRCQIYPGFVQINISPVGSRSRNHIGITLREGIALDWFQDAVRVAVQVGEISRNGEYHSKARGEICDPERSERVGL